MSKIYKNLLLIWVYFVQFKDFVQILDDIYCWNVSSDVWGDVVEIVQLEFGVQSSGHIFLLLGGSSHLVSGL